jgi:hypothetical protein
MTVVDLASTTARVSRSPLSRPLVSSAILLSLAAGIPGLHVALAQGAETKAADKAGVGARPDEKELLYTLIDQKPVALSLGTELINRKLTGTQFVLLVEGAQEETGKFDRVVARAMKSAELETVAGQMMKLYETGKLERARKPDEIAANIKALTGSIRGKLLARQRLIAAGEYAMPQMLSALLDKGNLTLQAEVSRLTIDMGRQAIMPLCAALPKLDPAQQMLVADVLGNIPYRTSLPFLSDLAANTKVQSLKDSCSRAIDRLGGARADVAGQYVELAEAYYGERPEVTSFPGEEHQLLWSFEPGSGLVMTAIRTPVFHEAVSMRLAERALVLRSEDPSTVALWVAANFKRELQTPQGYVNPAYTVGEGGRREAMYYAVASGAGVSQRVLGRAIDTRNSPLARKAIASIEQTAGAANLVAGESGGNRKPLLESLTFPNRRVQYEAALALAAAQPAETFPGSERVVPTLASAIREANSQYAAVVSQDAETYQALRKILEKSGFKVLPQARTLGDIQGPIAESPALDLVVVHNVTGERIPALIEEVRGTPKIMASPVLALTGTDTYGQLARRYDNDATIAVRQAAMGEEALTKSIKGLLDSASGGPISDTESVQYAARSIGALRDLAVSGNTVLNVGDASLQLISALNDAKGETKIRVAEVLSRIGQDRAQRSLMDSALALTGEERVRMLAMVAGSAKRFGNQLEQRHVARILELAASNAETEATAAAALMGALNLPNADVMKLILRAK